MLRRQPLFLLLQAQILVLELLSLLRQLDYLLLQFFVHREEGLLTVELLVGGWALHSHALADARLSCAVDVVGGAHDGTGADGKELPVLDGRRGLLEGGTWEYLTLWHYFDVRVQLV